jgi:hypothetical protein
LVERQERRITERRKAENPFAPPFSYRWVVQLDFFSMWLSPMPSFANSAFTNDRIHAAASDDAFPTMPLRCAIIPRHFAEALFYSVVDSTGGWGEEIDTLYNQSVAAGSHSMAVVQSNIATAVILSRLQRAGIPTQAQRFLFVSIERAAAQPQQQEPSAEKNKPESRPGSLLYNASAVNCAEVGAFHQITSAVLAAGEWAPSVAVDLDPCNLTCLFLLLCTTMSRRLTQLPDAGLLPDCAVLLHASYTGLCNAMVSVMLMQQPDPPVQVSLVALRARIHQASVWLAENIGQTSSLFIDMVRNNRTDILHPTDILHRVHFAVPDVLLMMNLLQRLLVRNSVQHEHLHAASRGVEHNSSSQNSNENNTALAQQDLLGDVYTLECQFWAQLVPWRDLMLQLQRQPHGPVCDPGRCASNSSPTHPTKEANDVVYWGKESGSLPGYCADYAVNGYGVNGYSPACCDQRIDSPSAAESDRDISTRIFVTEHSATFGVRFQIPDVRLGYYVDETQANPFSLYSVLTQHYGKDPRAREESRAGKEPQVDQAQRHWSKRVVQQEVSLLVHHLQDLNTAVSQFCQAHTPSQTPGGGFEAAPSRASDNPKDVPESERAVSTAALVSRRACVVTASARVAAELEAEIARKSTLHLERMPAAGIVGSVWQYAAARGYTAQDLEVGDGIITKLREHASPFRVEHALGALGLNELALQTETDERRRLLDRQDRAVKLITATALRGKEELAKMIAACEAPALYGLPPAFSADDTTPPSQRAPRTLGLISMIKVLFLGFDEARLSEEGIFLYPYQENALCPTIAAVLMHRIGSVMCDTGMFERALPWLRTAIMVGETDLAADHPNGRRVPMKLWLYEYTHAVGMVTIAKTVPRTWLDTAAIYADMLLNPHWETHWETQEETQRDTQSRVKGQGSRTHNIPTAFLLFSRARLHFAAGNTSASRLLYRTVYSQLKVRPSLSFSSHPPLPLTSSSPSHILRSLSHPPLPFTPSSTAATLASPRTLCTPTALKRRRISSWRLSRSTHGKTHSQLPRVTRISYQA